MTTEKKTASRNIRSVKLPWGDVIHSFMYSGQPHVFLKDIVDKLALDWKVEESNFVCDPSFEHKMIDPRELGLDIQSEEKHVAVDLSNLHGYLFSINLNQLDDEGHVEHIVMYKRECMKVLDNYWRFGQAINPAFYVNERCKDMAENGELSFEPERNFDKYGNFIQKFVQAAAFTSLDKTALKQAAELAEAAPMTGMNDLVQFLRAVKAVSPEAIKVKNCIDRMLVAVSESNFSGYIQDHLADYLSNRLLSDLKNNFFVGIRMNGNRSEGEMEFRLLSTLDSMISDFLIDMLGMDTMADVTTGLNQQFAA